MIPEAEWSLLETGSDRTHAALMLYGLEHGWLDTSAVDAALRGDASKHVLLRTVSERLSETLEQAARRVAEGIVPERDAFTLLAIGLPDDDRFHSPPDTPTLRVELCSLYHEEVPLSELPYALGVAVCVALQLVQRMFPLLVGEDVREWLWFEEELADDAQQLASEVDLDHLSVEALKTILDADPNRFLAIMELFAVGEDPEWVLGRLRELNVPPSPAKAAADRYLPVGADTRAAMLLQWLDDWRSDAPSLADHPLARWVERVATVVSRQIAEGRIDMAMLVQPEDGEFMPPEMGLVVTLGEEWADTSVGYLFERVQQGGESHLALMPLDPLALARTHATLMALAEGTVLLECLTALNR